MFRRSAALPGVATYLALRMVLLGWLAWQARLSGVPFLGSLVKADGQHYLTIARDGYAPLPAWPAAGHPPRGASQRSLAPARQPAAGSNTAIDSTCEVCGNMSTAPAAFSSNPPWCTSSAASRASVAGLHDT